MTDVVQKALEILDADEGDWHEWDNPGGALVGHCKEVAALIRSSDQLLQELAFHPMSTHAKHLIEFHREARDALCKAIGGEG